MEICNFVVPEVNEMRKIVLLLSVATAMVAVCGVVPTAAANKHRDEDGGGNDITGAADSNKLASMDDGDKRFPAAAEAAAVPAAEPQQKTKKQLSKQHNAKLLNRLGMKRVRTSGGSSPTHHRKRLASQSRSKYAAVGGDGKGGSDSQMFIVKLPPHSHFYDEASPAAVHQRFQQQQQQHHHLQHQYQQVPYKNLNTVPVGFVSNGKPAKVYHWNLPTIKHALQGRYKNGGNNDHLQAGDFELPSSAGSKIVPRRTLYYKPRAAGKPVKKSFVNNGKPNGFYVVSGKNANAAAAAVPQYHKIVKAYYGDD